MERRVRRSPEAVREAALAEARRLLISDGPTAMTLKAVAGALGMTHANLIHHFGSAEGLQSELIAEIVRDAAAAVEDAVARMRAGEAPIRTLVDVVFEAFDARGAGRLTAWMALSGDTRRLQPMLDSIGELVRGIETGASVADAHERVTSVTLMLVLAALGDSLIGPMLHKQLGREPGAMRAVTARLLGGVVAEGR